MSDAYDFSLNPAPAVSVLAVGDEAEPVLVADGVMRTPGALVDYAAREVSFQPPPAAEPEHPLQGRPQRRHQGRHVVQRHGAQEARIEVLGRRRRPAATTRS